MSDDEGYVEVTRGLILATWTVWCGRCSKWEYVGDVIGSPTEEAKANGWKNTKQDGWVCPDCLAQDRQDAA